MRNYADRNALSDLESLAGPAPRRQPEPPARVPSRVELEQTCDNDLFAALRGAQDVERERIRETLVLRHGGLVRWLTAQYAHPGIDAEELRQVGFLGLALAIDRFDPSRGFDFISYARPTVQGEMRRWFRDKRRWIRLPRRLQEAKATLRVAEGELVHRLGREPSRAELAEHTGMAPDLVAEALDADDTFTTASLDAPLNSSDGEEDFTVADTLGAPDAEIDLLLECQALRPLLAELSERDRAILHLRFFQELTQAQIGEQLGISQMHVSRLLARALTRLRAGLNDEHCEPAAGLPAAA